MKIRTLFLTVSVILSACSTTPTAPTEKASQYPADDAALTITPVNFAALPGWETDKLDGTIEALARSCAKLKAQDQTKAFGDPGWNISVGDWGPACSKIESGQAATDPRAFFQFFFTAYEATSGSYKEGLFTGYY